MVRNRGSICILYVEVKLEFNPFRISLYSATFNKTTLSFLALMADLASPTERFTLPLYNSSK